MQFANLPEKTHERMPSQLLMWGYFHQLMRRLAQQVDNDGFAPDIIAAIGQGGFIPARMLDDHLNLFDPAAVKIEHYHAVKNDSLSGYYRRDLFGGSRGQTS